MNRNEEANYTKIVKMCDWVERGVSYTEIQQRLAPKNSQEISNASVKNVQHALQSFSFIEKIKETTPFSKEDVIDKYDLAVFLSGKSIKFVKVQVKSSLTGVSEFYKEFDQNYYKADQIVKRKGLIVLNGQLPIENIQTIFKKQLSKIDQYFKIHPELAKRRGFSC